MSVSDVWASGKAYEPYVGRWSRNVAVEFLDWLAVPPGGNWLDVGCGTGALTQTILQQSQPGTTTSIDPSEGFIAYARENTPDKRASFRVGNAMSLPFEDNTFDAVVSGLVLNFVPNKETALAQITRVAKPGGTVGAYVWDYTEKMEMMRIFWDAAIELDPAVAEIDESRRFPICHPEPLAELFTSTSLKDVAVRAIDIPTHFRDFDDYWLPFLGGQGAAPAYVALLTEEQKVAVRERTKMKLPVASDGSISLIARAWAARGHK